MYQSQGVSPLWVHFFLHIYCIMQLHQLKCNLKITKNHDVSRKMTFFPSRLHYSHIYHLSGRFHRKSRYLIEREREREREREFVLQSCLEYMYYMHLHTFKTQNILSLWRIIFDFLFVINGYFMSMKWWRDNIKQTLNI